MGEDLDFQGNLRQRVERLEHECFLLRWIGFSSVVGVLWVGLTFGRPSPQPGRSASSPGGGEANPEGRMVPVVERAGVPVQPASPNDDRTQSRAASSIARIAKTGEMPRANSAGEVEATRIVLREADGEVKAKFGVEPEGVGLTLFDRGTERLTIRLLSSGCPEIALKGSGGQDRLRLVTDSDGRPMLALTDRGGVERVRAQVSPYGFPSLSILDPAGRERIELGYYPGEVPLLSLMGERGRQASLFVNPDGTAAQVFHAADGSQRASFGVDCKGSGTGVLLNAWNGVLFQADKSK